MTLLQLKEVEVEPLLFGARDAAKLLGISERTLWKLTKESTFPVVRIGGRTLWDASDLREWVTSMKQFDNGTP